MKNVFKFLGLFVLSFSVFSCSTAEESSDLTALDQELALVNDGVLKIDATTYIYKPTGETVKFLNNERQFNYEFAEELEFEITENSMKHVGGELLITNPETSEFINISHIEQLNSRTIRFDVELSTGAQFFGVVFETKKDIPAEKWHDDPALGIESAVLESFIEPTHTGNCSQAAVACEKSGGRATVALTHAHGWFTPSQGCQTVCN